MPEIMAENKISKNTNLWRTKKLCFQLSQQLTIIWFVCIFQHLEMFHELLEVGGKMFQKEAVVVLLLHQTDLAHKNISQPRYQSHVAEYQLKFSQWNGKSLR